MIKFFLSSFAVRSCHDSTLVRPVGQFMPPLLPGGETLNFDYSPLLVAKNLVMDKTSYEHIVSEGDGMPASVREQARILHQEGFIELDDCLALKPGERELIQKATAEVLQNPTAWDPVLINCVDEWFQMGSRYGKRFGIAAEPSGTIPYVLNEYLGLQNKYDDFDEAKRFWASLKSDVEKGLPDTRKALNDMHGILFDYVNTGMVMAQRNNAHNYEWDNLQHVFEEKAKRIGCIEQENEGKAEAVKSSVTALGRTASEFASVVIPYDFPSPNMSNVIDLLNDKRIHEVREAVQHLADERVPIDESLKNDFFKALLERDEYFRRLRRIDLFMKPLVGLLGFVPGGAHVTEGIKLILEAGLDVSDNLENVTREGRKRKKMADAMYVIHRNLKSKKGKLL